MVKSVQVFGRLKDQKENIIFTCSASGSEFNIASAECLRLANVFKSNTGSRCGCSKPVYKMIMCECCETHLIKYCNGVTVTTI